MKKITFFAALLFSLSLSLRAADIKISQLPLGSAALTNPADSFPYVNSSLDETERLTLPDIVNLPAFLTFNAPTCTRFFSTPSGCPSGQFATAQGANGNFTCSVPPGGGVGASYWQANPSNGFSGSPNVITASVGITSLANVNWQWIFVIGQTGDGAQLVTATPNIPAGSFVGQMLKLTGHSSSDYPIFQDQATLAGSGLDLNGPWAAKLNSTIVLSWDGIVWAEESRK